MEQTGNGREIEVRNLTGESVKVWIEPSNTVQDLKLLLRQCFSPASSSSNFHLFLKGVKLKLQTQISSFSTGDEEFLVMTPFLKKDRQQMQAVDARMSENTNPSESLESELADSAWVELMEDLSSLCDASSLEIQPEAEMESVDFVNVNSQGRRISLRGAMLNNDTEKGNLDDILNTLQNSGDILDEQSLPKILEFMDSSSCLYYPGIGSCVMRETNYSVDSESDPCTSNGSLCICPLWLKDLMRAFCFLNIYSACLQLQGKKITMHALEGPMAQLYKFGIQTTFAELEHLSEVCPQVIRFVSSEVGCTKLSVALAIIKFSDREQNQHEDQLILVKPSFEAEKRLSRSRIIYLMKKREDLLKGIFSDAVKSLMFSNGEVKGKCVSLEDLITSMKKADTMATKTEVKQRGRRNSSASCSRSYEVQCHGFEEVPG